MTREPQHPSSPPQLEAADYALWQQRVEFRSELEMRLGESEVAMTHQRINRERLHQDIVQGLRYLPCCQGSEEANRVLDWIEEGGLKIEGVRTTEDGALLVPDNPSDARNAIRKLSVPRQAAGILLYACVTADRKFSSKEEREIIEQYNLGGSAHRFIKKMQSRALNARLLLSAVSVREWLGNTDKARRYNDIFRPEKQQLDKTRSAFIDFHFRHFKYFGELK